MPEKWTEDEVKKLESMTDLGLNSAQIAEHLPGRTRSAVIGKLKYMGITGIIHKKPPIHQRYQKKGAEFRIGNVSKTLDISVQERLVTEAKKTGKTVAEVINDKLKEYYGISPSVL